MSVHLLIVDDDEVDRQTVRRALAAAGVVADVQEVGDADAALDAIAAGNPDCVLLDYRLPRVDGLELIRRVRALGAAMPIIVLTGQGDEQLAVELMKAGAVDYLSKQALTPDRLERSLRHALAISHAEQERQRLLEREQDARREAQAANRAKDEFLAALSHELRTPLNAILGWARLLGSDAVDGATARRAVETIERNAQIQAKLIDDLLDLSGIVTGKLRLELQPHNLSSLVESVVDSLRPQAGVKSVAIAYRQVGDERPVMCDPPRFHQIVNNLLTNAIKFTPESGRVEVTLTHDDRGARLTVHDSGSGIDPSFLPYVFDRFRQADGTTTRRHGGLGLGLSIVRHLVELHGGTVEARSPGAGSGATFEVKLPLAGAGVVVEPAPAQAAASQVPSLAGLHVLVVDDEADARELLATILERHGARVSLAGSAAEATERLAQDPPDVLLSDIAMPGEDGYSLIRRIRRSQANGLAAVPAAAFTAYATAADRARALLAGFNAHLTKPVEPDEVAALVASLSGRTAPTRA